jgi:hypothetical protein
MGATPKAMGLGGAGCGAGGAAGKRTPKPELRAWGWHPLERPLSSRAPKWFETPARPPYNRGKR